MDDLTTMTDMELNRELFGDDTIDFYKKAQGFEDVQDDYITVVQYEGRLFFCFKQ